MRKIFTSLLAVFLFISSIVPLSTNAAEKVSIEKNCLSQKSVDLAIKFYGPEITL